MVSYAPVSCFFGFHFHTEMLIFGCWIGPFPGVAQNYFPMIYFIIYLRICLKTVSGVLPRPFKCI